MAGIDLSHLLPSIPLGPQVVAEAKVQLIVDASAGTVRLHIDDHIGPLAGPALDVDVNPLHALHVAANGLGSLIGGALAKKP